MKKLKSEELGRLNEEEVRQSKRASIIVILDDVRSGHNVGSIFRTCDAFLIEELMLCGFTPTPPHREINRSALGSTRTVKWEHFKDGPAAIAAARQRGYAIYAIEHTSSSLQLNEMAQHKNAKVALVFGNEVNGISDASLKECSEAFEIPMFGNKHSFNVSVCAGIVLWETWRSVGMK